MSDSVRPHRRQPTRLPCPWDSPGKNTGVGCHFLLQCLKVKSESEVTQSCPTLHDPMDCSPPGSSVHGIFQAKVLEWGAITFSVIHANPCLMRSWVLPHILGHEFFTSIKIGQKSRGWRSSAQITKKLTQNHVFRILKWKALPYPKQPHHTSPS